MRSALAALMSVALLAGCGDSAGVGEIAAEWSAEEEERGDTLVVRTVFVVGSADAYVLDREAPDGTVLRIERAVEPVSVEADEGARARENVEQGFRSRDA